MKLSLLKFEQGTPLRVLPLRVLPLRVLLLGVCVLMGGGMLRPALEAAEVVVENTRISEERFFSVKPVPHVYDPLKLVRVADVPLVFENGILFTFLSSQENEELYLSGSFLEKAALLPLQKGVEGIYYVFVPINLPAGAYTYRFLRNSIWINDPKQFYQERDPLGKSISAFRLAKDIEYHHVSPVRIEHRVFTFYLKDAGYRDVYWMGTANVWNTTRDKMILKNGYWRIHKYLSPDEPYYAFLIDGNLSLDPFNSKIALTSFRQEASVVATQTKYFFYERNP